MQIAVMPITKEHPSSGRNKTLHIWQIKREKAQYCISKKEEKLFYLSYVKDILKETVI